MILHIYAFNNKAVEAFASPIFSDKLPEDYLAIVQRAIKYAVYTGKDDMHYEDLELYSFGTFDDESGAFDIHVPGLVLDCSEYKSQLLEAKEKHEN